MLVTRKLKSLVSGTVLSRIFLKFIFDILAIYLALNVAWSWVGVTVVQTAYVYKRFSGMYVLTTDEQIYTHAGLYVSWVTTMALLRNTNQTDYLTESLIETISIDKGYCRGNVYAAAWYLVLLVIYVTHVIHLYWTFTHKKHLVPDVKRFQTLPPKIK